MNPYLYNGKELDAMTGLYYFGARYYDPFASVFLGVDPMMDKHGDFSPFAYCYNNPVNFVDPLGLDTVPAGDVSFGNFNLADDVLDFGSSSTNNYVENSAVNNDQGKGTDQGRGSLELTGELQQTGMPIAIPIGVTVSSSAVAAEIVTALTIAFPWVMVFTLPQGDVSPTQRVGKGNANYPGPLSYTVPDKSTPFYNPPEPPDFNPGEYEGIVKWAAGMTLGARILQKIHELPDAPSTISPADATSFGKDHTPIPIMPDL